MKISFGICVGSTQYVEKLLKSIWDTVKLAPFYNFSDPWEVIVCASPQHIKEIANIQISSYLPMEYIAFTDDRPWITKKKNMIADVASFENLCIVHDYLKFDDQWLTGAIRFENKEWQVLLNRVENLEGTRHADWLVDPDRMLEVIKTDPERFTNMLMAVAPRENGPQYVSGLPYSVADLSHIQYVSGGSFLIKRDILKEIPFNEDMFWGDPPGEDVEWSRRLIEKEVRFTFNPYSIMHIQKPGKWYCSQMPADFVTELSKYYGV